MREHVRVTEDTEVEFTPIEHQDIDLEALEALGEVTLEDEELVSCTLELDRLVDALAVYSSLEEQRYDWR